MFRSLFSKSKTKVASKKIIDDFRNDPHAPFLISFPRTGSHWLRMMLEQYSDRPLLVRSFYEHDNKNYLLLHTHDMQLLEKRKNVLYLYRQPIDVVYSQLNFYQQDIRNLNLVLHWTNQYVSHLIHWLFLEQHTERKTIICYEKLKADLPKEFQKVTEHLDLEFDAEKLSKISDQISKATVVEKTAHDKRVMNLNPDYEQQRKWFRETYQSIIHDCCQQLAALTLKDENQLLGLFE